MTIMILPGPPDRDAPLQQTRRSTSREEASAFGREMAVLEEKDGAAAPDAAGEADGVAPANADAELAEGKPEPKAAAGDALARDLIGLLSGAAGAVGTKPAPQGSDTSGARGENRSVTEMPVAAAVLEGRTASLSAMAETPAEMDLRSATGDASETPVATSSDAQGPRQTDIVGVLPGRTVPEAQNVSIGGPLARSRVEILRQETHFEPAGAPALFVEAAQVLPDASERRQAVETTAPPSAKAADAAAPAASSAEDATTGLLPLVARRSGASRPSPTAAEDRFGAKPADRTVPVASLGAAPVGPSQRDPAEAPPRVSRGTERAENQDCALGILERPVARATASAAASAPQTGVPAVAEQVAARIVDAFASLSGSPAASPALAPYAAADLPSETHLRLRAGGAALKTLTIQLQPEHLGTLDISMRLTDGQLTLELAAGRAETARLLVEDRATLRGLLEKAGFSVDEASIAIVVRDTFAAGPAGADTRRDPDASNGRAQDRPGGQDGSRREDGERPQRPVARDAAMTAPFGARRSGDAVFL